MKKLLALMALAIPALSQPLQTVIIQPDCVIPFQFTAANQIAPANINGVAAFNNKQTGCNVWQIQYANTGFAPISLVLQSAPDNAGVPGVFGTISGTVTQGVNPNTNTTGASTLITTFGTAFAPWVRITPTTATGAGNITGVVLGFRPLSSAGGSVTGTVNATITSPLGQQPMASGVSVTLPNNQTSGCLKTFVNLAGSGNTQIVAASGTTKIYICDMEFSTGAGEDFKLTEGTGANCAVGGADVTALLKNILSWSLTPAGGFAGGTGTATGGDALCANQSVAQAAGVTIWYLQF